MSIRVSSSQPPVSSQARSTPDTGPTTPLRRAQKEIKAVRLRASRNTDHPRESLEALRAGLGSLNDLANGLRGWSRQDQLIFRTLKKSLKDDIKKLKSQLAAIQYAEINASRAEVKATKAARALQGAKTVEKSAVKHRDKSQRFARAHRRAMERLEQCNPAAARFLENKGRGELIGRAWRQGCSDLAQAWTVLHEAARPGGWGLTALAAWVNWGIKGFIYRHKFSVSKLANARVIDLPRLGAELKYGILALRKRYDLDAAKEREGTSKRVVSSRRTAAGDAKRAARRYLTRVDTSHQQAAALVAGLKSPNCQ